MASDRASLSRQAPAAIATAIKPNTTDKALERRSLRRTSSFPTTGMLFSAWQAITQEEQPEHLDRSMTMAQWWGPFGWGSYMLGCTGLPTPPSMGRAEAGSLR